MENIESLLERIHKINVLISEENELIKRTTEKMKKQRADIRKLRAKIQKIEQEELLNFLSKNGINSKEDFENFFADKTEFEKSNS